MFLPLTTSDLLGSFFIMTFDDSVQLLNKRLILLFPSKMSIELKTYKWDDVDFDS